MEREKNGGEYREPEREKVKKAREEREGEREERVKKKANLGGDRCRKEEGGQSRGRRGEEGEA